MGENINNEANVISSLRIDFSKVNPATVGAVSRAAYAGDIDMLKDLIMKNASIRSRDNQGMTPLHYAAFKGKFDCLVTLLEAGPDEVDCQTFEGLTALDIACSSPIPSEALYDIIATLFQYGATSDNTRELYICSLNNLIKSGNLPAVHLFLSHGADISICDSRYGTPLHASICLGETEIVRYLINRGAEDLPLNSHYGFFALHTAITYTLDDDTSRVMAEVLTHDVCRKNINKSDSDHEWTVLFMACMRGCCEAVEMLLDNGADANICNSIDGSPLLQLLLTMSRHKPESHMNCMKRLTNLTSHELLMKESSKLMCIGLMHDCPFLVSKLISSGVSPNGHFRINNLNEEDVLVGTLLRLRELIPSEAAGMSPLGIVLYYANNENDDIPELVKVLLDAGCSLKAVKDEDGIDIIPPIVMLSIFYPKQFNARSKCQYNILQEILKLNPDLEWNSLPDTPIPDIYLAPLFTGNLCAFVILLQWGVPAEVMFTRERCTQLVQYLEKCHELDMQHPGWYVKILNEFIPILYPALVDIYQRLDFFCNMKTKLLQCIGSLKTLKHLSILAVRKQLYKANKRPLKTSVDILCQGRPQVVHNQLLFNHIIKTFSIEDPLE